VTTAHPNHFVGSLRRSPELRALAVIGGAFAVLAALILLILTFMDWNLLRGPLAGVLSGATGRRVEISGDLKVHLLTAQPSVSIGGIRVGQPAWVRPGAPDLADIGRVVVQTRWTSLLSGRPILPLVEADHPSLDLLRGADGRDNWTLGQKAAGAGPKLPPIQHFVIDNGKLHFVDAARKMVIDGSIDSDERTGGAAAHAFSLVGHGAFNGNAFDITATGGPLINVRIDQPYPFSGALRMGGTHVEAKGELRRPFDLSAFSTRLDLHGPDLADLYFLTGLALPNTPVYALRAELKHKGAAYDISDLEGRIGSSDISGVINVSKASGRPFVSATLHSRSLDFADLAALTGGAPGGKSARTANAAQKIQAKVLAAERRVLPDSPLQSERLRGMDARLDYSAETVKDTVLPLRSARLHLTLDHGLLIMDPLDFDLAQGRFTSAVSLNARGAQPVTAIDARLTNAQLQNFLPASAGRKDAAAPPIEGQLVARVKLTGRGDSVHKAAASANGAVTLVIPHGRMRRAFAELLGVNAGKGLGLLLSKNKDESEIRCGVAAFKVVDGRLNADQILLDTDVVRVSGQGSADLRDETLKVVLNGDTKRFRLTHVFLPITIEGPFRSPKLGVEPGPVLAQGAAALALGVMLTPLAAILPFVDPGLAKNADCQALMAQARTTAAPVKGQLSTSSSKK
jgi:uncharacterized protein involved in outer membrane biogenesis